MINQQFIQTHSLYVALYDQSSPTNHQGFMAAELGAAREAAKRSGQENLCLFHFNESLTRHVVAGQMLAWTLLFDGVFTFEIRVEPGRCGASAMNPQASEPLPCSAVLQCPSGRLVVSCLSEMGKPVPIAIDVDPGEYRATLGRNEAAEFDHALLESVEGYEASSGPDWSILLQRVGM